MIGIRTERLLSSGIWTFGMRAKTQLRLWLAVRSASVNFHTWNWFCDSKLWNLRHDTLWQPNKPQKNNDVTARHTSCLVLSTFFTYLKTRPSFLSVCHSDALFLHHQGSLPFHPLPLPHRPFPLFSHSGGGHPGSCADKGGGWRVGVK